MARVGQIEGLGSRAALERSSSGVDVGVKEGALSPNSCSPLRTYEVGVMEEQHLGEIKESCIFESSLSSISPHLGRTIEIFESEKIEEEHTQRYGSWPPSFLPFLF